jgi:hypothetical protein
MPVMIRSKKDKMVKVAEAIMKSKIQNSDAPNQKTAIPKGNLMQGFVGQKDGNNIPEY